MHEFDLNMYFNISEEKVTKLYIRGALPPPEYKRVVIVGTRKPTNYGKSALKEIISGLAGYPITIISGLALGTDSLVHNCALSSNIHTLALPGSGISDGEIYPRTNLNLAHQIIASGGALLSQWESQAAAPWTFPVRNKTLASLADIVVVTEALLESGTLITANDAFLKNKIVAALPGNIDSVLSAGPNSLLKRGAICIT